MHDVAVVRPVIPSQLSRRPVLGQGFGYNAWPCILQAVLWVLAQRLCLFFARWQIEGDAVTNVVLLLSKPARIEPLCSSHLFYSLDLL